MVSHLGEERFYPSGAVASVNSNDTCQDQPDRRTAGDGLEVVGGEPDHEKSSGIKMKENVTAQFPVSSHNAPILGSSMPGRPRYLLPTTRKLERDLSQGHESTRTISREVSVPHIMPPKTEYSGIHSMQSLSIPPIMQAQSEPDHFCMYNMQASIVRDHNQHESQRSYSKVHQEWQQAYGGIPSNMQATASEIRASPDLSVPMLTTSAGMVSPAAGRRTLTSFHGNTPITVQIQDRDQNTPASRRTTDWERALELLSSAFADAQSQAAGAHVKSRGNVVDQLIDFSSHTIDHTVYTVQTESQNSSVTSPFAHHETDSEDTLFRSASHCDIPVADRIPATVHSNPRKSLSPSSRLLGLDTEDSVISGMRSQVDIRARHAAQKWVRRSPSKLLDVPVDPPANRTVTNFNYMQPLITPDRHDSRSNIELPAENTMRFAVPHRISRSRSQSPRMKSGSPSQRRIDAPSHVNSLHKSVNIRSSEDISWNRNQPPEFGYEEESDGISVPVLRTQRKFKTLSDDFSVQQPKIAKMRSDRAPRPELEETSGTVTRRRPHMSENLMTLTDDFRQLTHPSAPTRSHEPWFDTLVGTGFSDYENTSEQRMTGSRSPPQLVVGTGSDYSACHVSYDI